MSANKYDTENPEKHLRQAAYMGDINEVRRLIAYKKVDPNIAGMPSGKTALHQAAARNKVDVVSYLLQQGADPALEDSEGKTPENSTKSKEIKILLSLAPNALMAIDFAKTLLPGDSSLRFFGSSSERNAKEKKIQTYDAGN